MYSLATKDGEITANERSMLNLQAKSYGITEERRVHLEGWYDTLDPDKKTTEGLAKKYGSSGVNMMSVFGTTGEAPIDEKEIQDAFSNMDTNNDDVISSDEFSKSPEVSKLPPESQSELFQEIDLNEDGVIQYEEFKIQAQITESEVLSIGQEKSYLEAYKIAMEDGVVTEDERKMLNFQAQAFGISEDRIAELENAFNNKIVD